MSALRVHMMMSLDGFVAGPEQSAEIPFGIGGLLGSGARLFGDLGGPDAVPTQVQAIEAPGVTHIGYRVE